MQKYITSIGMEVHAELLTKSGMFCRCPNEFGGEPNTRICPICLGLPGALPVPNQYAIELVLKTALALNCKIAMHSIFHRKNYFYPDLPKGYQISQYGETNPLGYDGYLEIPLKNGNTKKIRIKRVHLEEDTGKLMHMPSGGSGVDYNRSGLPLMEIVTAFPPDIESAEEAKEYLVQLRQILMYIGACNGKMEEGSLRCEPNISVRLQDSDTFGTKTELKNLNSFKNVQLGIEYETKRQIEALEKGEQIYQETRGWDENKGKSFVMRVKEHENDYRYFPDPDLPPMHFEEAYIESLRDSLPELPLVKSTRYQKDFGLSAYDAELLVADQAMTKYFEEALELGGDPKTICNWMNSDLAKLLNETGESIHQTKVTPKHLVELTDLITAHTISGKIGKTVLTECFKSGKPPTHIVEEKGLTQITNSTVLEEYVKEAIASNPGLVEKYRSGQQGVSGFFVGEVMKKSHGKANPALVQLLVSQKLEQS